jgi:hypothetical protein
MAQRIRVLITVKAYPQLSEKYKETVCVAGIRMDTRHPRHVRLFPVPFRDLERAKQFEKYDIVEVHATEHVGDSRPESLRPNLGTLERVTSTRVATGRSAPGGSPRWSPRRCARSNAASRSTAPHSECSAPSGSPASAWNRRASGRRVLRRWLPSSTCSTAAQEARSAALPVQLQLQRPHVTMARPGETPAIQAR